MNTKIIGAIIIVYLILLLVCYIEKKDDDRRYDQLIYLLETKNYDKYSKEDILELIKYEKELRTLKKSKLKKMIKDGEASMIAGGIFGLATQGPMAMITNGSLWFCVGGIKSYIMNKHNLIK